MTSPIGASAKPLTAQVDANTKHRVKESSRGTNHPSPNVIYQQEKPVIVPYKPPEKGPPPGANLYNDVWDIFRVGVHTILCINEPIPYFLGFSVGAIKTLYEWSENGAPKKISGDPARIDFAATAHTSSLSSQITILGEYALALLIPLAVNSNVFKNTIDPLIESTFPFPFKGPSLTVTSKLQAYNDIFTKKPTWPSSWSQVFKWTWIFSHGVTFGEEIVQRTAQWIDPPKQK
jgi:hypothetical protein